MGKDVHQEQSYSTDYKVALYLNYEPGQYLKKFLIRVSSDVSHDEARTIERSFNPSLEISAKPVLVSQFLRIAQPYLLFTVDRS